MCRLDTIHVREQPGLPEKLHTGRAQAKRGKRRLSMRGAAGDNASTPADMCGANPVTVCGTVGFAPHPRSGYPD